MTGKLVLGNLTRRPLRTAATAVAVAVEVSLILLVVGLTQGMVREVAKRIEGVGADILVQPPSSSVLLAFSGAPMPASLGQRLAALEGVRAVAPVLVQPNTSHGLDLIYGIDPQSFDAVSDGFVFHEGHGLRQPDDVLVDDWYARARHLHAGQTLRLLDHDFHIAGVVEHGKGARIFVRLDRLQELTGARDRVSLFFVRCQRPELTPTVMEKIRSLLPRHQIRPVRQYLSLMTATSLPGLDVFVRSMIGLGVAVGFLVIFLAMYTAIVERRREIAILKSLGASRAYIAGAFLVEALSIAAAGLGVGLGLSYALRGLILYLFPTLSIEIAPPWVLRAAALAVLAAALGSAYPAWLASRKDPLEALACE